MQPPTDGPRAGYTVAQVQYLIENSSSFDTDMGLELIDQDLKLVDQFESADLHAATVNRNSYANLHSTLTFTIDSPLDWGLSIVRPYMTMTGPISPTGPLTTMPFYLGAYVTDTPAEDMSNSPSSFDATGYDLLSILDDAVGDTYSVDAGEFYLTRVEEILLASGFTQYVIEQDRASSALASPRTYNIDDNVTWLTIINDLLGAVGYAGIWADWNGVLHCETYRSPRDRSPEWYFTDDPAVTLLTQRRKRHRDFYDAPNRWVFYRSSNTEDEQPSAGNGFRYEYVNETDGDTSVEGRGGRTRTKVVGVDAADTVSLQAYARRTIDADMLIPTVVSLETAPFPLAWHFDRYVVSDAGLGVSMEVLATSWSMNLDGSDVSWEWTAI